MKRFTRKISAVLIAALLFMTAAPNLAYANDDIDFTSQTEITAESAPESEPAPAAESTPEASPAPVIESAPESGTVPAAESTPEPNPVPDNIQEPEVIQPSEQILTAGNEPAPGNGSDEAIGGDAIFQSEQSVQGTNYKADKALITPENLTVLLRGLNDSNKADTMLLIDKYVNTVVQQGLPVNITGPTFVDAEKFSTGTAGFDSQHCWAATASNILWTTGYAQQAINPITNTNFRSEDEVLAYFTANFTDYPGIPEDGVNWFMKGTSAYSIQNMEGVAHYTDAASGALLSNKHPNSSMIDLWNDRWDSSNPDVNKGTPDTISSLLSVCSQGMGVLVKWYENNSISRSAHWMTVVGAIIDESTNVLADKYKALIIADSDSNPVHREGGVNFNETTYEQKLMEKANCVNSYTVYQLKFVSGLNGNGAWRLVGFGENANKIAVLNCFYSLLDSDKHPQGAHDNTTYDLREHLINSSYSQYSTDSYLTVNVREATPQSDPGQVLDIQENKDAVVITDGQSAIVISKEDILSALSEAQLETSENLANLLEYMTENNVEIFPQAKGIVSVANGDNYVAYIKDPIAAKLTISVDGIVLPEDAYEIIILPNGMIKLRIKNSYLKALSIGVHNLQINDEGAKSVINSLINVSE